MKRSEMLKIYNTLLKNETNTERDRIVDRVPKN